VRALGPQSLGSWLGALTTSGSPVVAVSWALYDFANTIFSFAIVSFAMILWSTRFLGEAAGTFWLTAAVSASVLLNAIVSPILGAMSDRVGRRKPFLAFFTALCIAPTVVIGAVDIAAGLLLFAVANFAYQSALIYYDALLATVARPERRGRLAGIGVGLGYVGTIVSALLLRLTFEAGQITSASFVMVGALFAIFAAPIFFAVREGASMGPAFRVDDALRSWSQLATTLRHAREVRGLLRFIVARLFYSDAINTAIVAMTGFAVFAIGFSQNEALNILLVLTVVAVLASFGWGWLADRFGPKRTLLAVLGSWVVGLLIIGLVLAPVPFLIAGAILGSGLGGVAVTDRLVLLRLSPPERVGEFFGLYGMVGKLSAVIGPVLYGSIVAALLPVFDRAAYQVAIFSLLALMLVGIWIVRSVPDVGAARAGERVGKIEPAAVPPAP
jgi:UMF1 family MFS transporter